MSVVFFTNAYSTYCTRVRFLLEECGHAYSPIEIDLGKQEQHLPSFVEQNPMRKVPSINLGSLRLSESQAIMRYLSQRFERYDLYPTNLEERADVDQWLDFTNQHICKYIGELVWYRAWAPKFKFPVNPQADAHAEKFLLQYLPVVDQHLNGRNFLCGSQLTIADIGLIPFLDILPKVKLTNNTFTSIQRYSDQIMKRDSWNRTKALIK